MQLTENQNGNYTLDMLVADELEAFAEKLDAIGERYNAHVFVNFIYGTDMPVDSRYRRFVSAFSRDENKVEIKIKTLTIPEG